MEFATCLSAMLLLVINCWAFGGPFYSSLSACFLYPSRAHSSAVSLTVTLHSACLLSLLLASFLSWWWMLNLELYLLRAQGQFGGSCPTSFKGGKTDLIIFILWTRYNYTMNNYLNITNKNKFLFITCLCILSLIEMPQFQPQSVVSVI